MGGRGAGGGGAFRNHEVGDGGVGDGEVSIAKPVMADLKMLLAIETFFANSV